MNNSELLSQAFLERQPQASAALLQEFAPEQAALFLKQMPVPVSVPTVAAMSSWPAARILSQIPVNHCSEILRKLSPPKAETLLRLMTTEARDRILKCMPDSIAKSFKLKLAYPLSTVGAWMDTSIPHFTSDSSVADCLDLVKRQQSHLGGIIIVVDDHRHLIGLVGIDNLLTCETQRPLIELIGGKATTLSARATLWEVKNHNGWSHYPSLPVTDSNNVILGALTYSALIEGTRKTTVQQASSHRFSLVTHMSRAFFVALSGLVKVIFGISENQASPTQGAKNAPHRPPLEASEHE